LPPLDPHPRLLSGRVFLNRIRRGLRFAPGDLTLHGDAVGETVANILSNSERSLTEDLGNFARIAESGGMGASQSR
jgi:hypothetical protein